MKIRAVRPYSGPVDADGKVTVFDITVEDNHTYCLEAGITVSNSKRISMLDVNALLSHGSTETLRDAGSIRGQKSEDYWMQFMQGYTPREPKVPLVYEKFVNQLKAAGINVVSDGSQLNVMAMTNKDVDTLASDRLIRTGDTVHFNKDLKPVPGGLFDPKLTGGHGGRQWSAIELDEPMPNPVMEEPIRRILGLTEKRFLSVLSGEDTLEGFGTGPKAITDALDDVNLPKEIARARVQMTASSASKRDEAIRKLGYLKSAQQSGLHPRDWVLNKAPVLPPIFRPVSVMGQSGMPLVSDVNYLYKDLLEANKNLTDMKKVLGHEGVGAERLSVYHAFKAVTGLGEPVSTKSQEKKVGGVLKSIFSSSPKFGTVQRKLLSSTVDNVGRAVIVPNPNYDMDTIGIPETKAFDVYGKFIARRLRRTGMPLTQALRHIKDKSDLARDALQEEMKERPVFVNRAPVLHKFGIMAFHPRLVKGDVMQISPLIVKGFGADFDGDQQINHVFLALPTGFASDINTDTMSLSGLVQEHNMPFDTELNVPVLWGYRLYCVDLSDFPHGKRIKTTRGQFGSIDWYEIPDGAKVLTHDAASGSLRWRQATVWSVHHGCPVVMVNLLSGRQIITDDDPRAVYGMAPCTLEMKRARPSESIGFMVPRLRRLRVPAGIPDGISMKTSGWSGAKDRLHLRSRLVLDESFGYLLGVAAGDGWATANGRDFCVAGITQDIIDKVDGIISGLFDTTAPTYCMEINHGSYGESRRATWTSCHLATMIADMVGQRAECKQLPPFFLTAPLPFRFGLLAGMMDTDGSISLSHAKKRPQLMANISSRSLRLLRECGLLLWSLSMHSRITASKTPAGKPFWVLSITNADIKRWGGNGMVHPDKLAALSRGEVGDSPNAAKQDLIPISASLATAMCVAMPTPKDRTKWPEGQSVVYPTLSKAKKTGYITRFTAKRVPDFLPKGFSHPDLAIWQRLVDDDQVTWDRVESYDNTETVETGYDLTVPGPETFVSADGVFLSNTMQFHVPTDPKAVEEARERMLPSKNLLSPADFKSPMHMPGQEYLGGLYHATTAKKEKARPRVFRNKQDALAAYARGEIDADDPVEIHGD